MVYRRERCELCEQAVETVESVAADAGVAVDVDEVDVDDDPDLRERHGERVPVVFVDGAKQFEIRVDPTVLVGVLRDAADG
jgi:prepilin-type processing-associated H-X9-DG protein